MAVTIERLKRIRARCETVQVLAQFPFPNDETLNNLPAEVRQAVRERLVMLKTALQASLQGAETAPAVPDLSWEQLAGAMEHAATAVQNVNEMVRIIDMALNFPPGFNPTAAQRQALEDRIIALRDAALAEVALI